MDATTSEASRRVQLLETPIMSPGNCGICGKSSHPVGFADARLDFEFYGTLYFCGDCVGDFARLFGFLSPEETERLRNSNQILKGVVADYQAQFERIQGVITGAFTPGVSDDSSDNDATDADVLPTDVVGDTEDVSDDDQLTFDLTDRRSEGAAEVSEPVSEQGSSGVSVDPGSDDTLSTLGL